MNKKTTLSTGCKILYVLSFAICNYFLELWFVEFINKYIVIKIRFVTNYIS